MKIVQYILFFFLLIQGGVTLGQDAPQAIEIPDFYLDKAIRDYYDKPTGPITKEDLSRMTRFVLSLIHI